MRVLTSGAVALQPNGALAVTLECQLPSPCRGALLVDLSPACSGTAALARSDLVVDAGSTRTIGVPLSSCATTLVRSRGRLPAAITADSGQSPQCHGGQVDCVNSAVISLRPPG
jgi:hypothetical protein